MLSLGVLNASDRNSGATLRPVLYGTAATAGLMVAFTSAQAQTQTPPANAPATLPPVTATGEQPGIENTNSAPLNNNRMPDTVREIPRVIQVVPQELIEQQRAQTLEQVLRNVPGMTVAAGEGNGGIQGEQYRIRGLTARGDIYLDGLKDYGVHVHDTFNTESVQVLKGPGGDGFGNGSTGGLINQSSKRANLVTGGELTTGFGEGLTNRTTLDYNYKIDDSTALRLNGMFYKQDAEGANRDNIERNRHGFAADLGFGLNGPTELHLSYVYMKNKSRPDHGVPFVNIGGSLTPITEFGLDPSISYARDKDRDNTANHIFTSAFAHDAGGGLSFYNDTRFSHYKRDFAITTPGTLGIPATNQFLSGLNPLIAVGAGGGLAHTQEGWAVQNVAGLKVEGDFLGLRHKASAGLDLSYHEDHRQQGRWVGRVNNQTVWAPDHAYAANAFIAYDDAGGRESNTHNAGLFFGDRMWITDQVSLQGRLRIDYFKTKFMSQTSSQNGANTESTISPTGALIWEPNKEMSVYASYARSVKPTGVDIANNIAGGNNDNARALEPEKSDLYEVGTKLDFLGGALGLTGAAFLIEKSNAFAVDPATGVVANGQGEAGVGVRIRGVEAGLTGKITPQWSVYVGYALLDGKITDNLTGAASVGKVAPGVPKNNGNLWTTYAFPTAMTGLGGTFQIGGGVQYVSSYYLDNNNAATAPDHFALDAMASYEYENLSLALNLYNLTNEVTYTQLASGRATPGAGRTFMITGGVKF